jgi:maleamate amidohydrolase
MGYRLGVDVGGTFTDLLLVDEVTGEIHAAKVPSTPDDSSRGVMAGVARSAGVPVVKCYTAYESARDVPPWKVEAMHRDFFYGSPATEPDPRLHDPDYDYTFCKTAASIFFQTPLTAHLARHGIDTTIIAGCTTSGCVRASVVDAFSHGFRPIIPEDCVGDGAEEPRRSNLLDMDRRYADVTSSAEVIAYLRGL